MSRATQSLRYAVLKRDGIPPERWHDYECHHIIPRRLLTKEQIFDMRYCRAIPSVEHKRIHAVENKLRDISEVKDEFVKVDLYRGFIESLEK